MALRDAALASAECPNATLPLAVFAPQPQYPSALRKQRIQGLVAVEGIILADGTVAYPRVIKADQPDLAPASLSVFKTYRYKPGTCSGKPVPRFVTVSHSFRLQ
ncbi:MAG: energy transducer TonB [Thermoanaerobaculia bacterium]|jgi:outer membrane biosynthesis protein TonB